MIKIGFVILHYGSIEDTKECVCSIIDKLDVKDYEIYVVDNCSPDKSGKQLYELYEQVEKVNIILNNANLGFSKGNNIGIAQALKDGCEFVVVLNNDTCLIQDDFFSVIEKEYKNSNFAVLGPKVYSIDGKDHSSPIGDGKVCPLPTLRAGAILYVKLYIKVLLGLDKFSFRKIQPQAQPEQSSFFDANTRYENVALHGCCLVFSPAYFEKYVGFEELTFMYDEETILKMNCDNAKLLMVYNPKLLIYHKEAVATNANISIRKKKIRTYKRLMEATWAIYRKAKKDSKSNIIK